MRALPFSARGVIPACILPFNEDLSINEDEYRRHIEHVASTNDISGIIVNGHASEVASCSFDEQTRVLNLTIEQIGNKIPIINGVYADSSELAAKIALMSEDNGASALLVFPPEPLSLGGMYKPDMVLKHFHTIASVTNLPIIAFQYPLSTHMGYSLDTMVRMAQEIPSFVAIKDWCNDPMLHQKHINVLQNLTRPINVLTTHSSWLLSSLVMKPKGLISGSGSIIADLHNKLWNAVSAGDLKLAQSIDEKIYPLAQMFYAQPTVDMHNRMKEGLVMLGLQKRAVVRPPLTPISDPERQLIKDALIRSGMLGVE